MRDYRSKHFKSKENAKKDRARAYTTSLLKRGKIERGPCNDCGATKTQAHHPDYDNPRVVEWLCETCHRARHKAERSKNAQSIHSFLYGK